MFLESHVVTSDDGPALTGRASIFDLKIFEQSAFVNNHLLCYWPTIHNSISKICLKFQIISSTFSRSMSCSMSTEQKMCEVKIFQLQSMTNTIKCIDQRFAFKISRISCLALTYNLNNPRTTVLYAKNSVAGGEIRRFIHRLFRAIDTNQWLSG